jgi:hypothetical protein
MGLEELPSPAVESVWAALGAHRSALRAVSRSMRAAMNACVTCVNVGDGDYRAPVDELPRLLQRFPRLRELRLQPHVADWRLNHDDGTCFRYLLPALEALPSACLPAVERAGPSSLMQLLDPLAVVQLARLCPGLTRIAFGAVPDDCGHVGAALEALAAGCHGLAALDLHIGISPERTDSDVDGPGEGIDDPNMPPAASAEAVAAAAAGLRRLGGGLRELSVRFCISESDSAAAGTLLPAALPALTALTRLAVCGESGVVVGAPCGGLRELIITHAEPIGAVLATLKGPLPGVTSLYLSHESDR